MAQLETATTVGAAVGVGLDTPTRGSERWKTWKSWQEGPQPCLMRDKRVARQMGGRCPQRSVLVGL